MSIDTIDRIAAERYGHGLESLDPVASLWLADFILHERGENVFQVILEYREANGKATRMPGYGSELWVAWIGADREVVS